MTYNISTSPLHKILLEGRREVYPKNHSLQFSDKYQVLSWIESGYIKRFSIDNDGTNGIQAIYGPGDIFPLTPVFNTLFEVSIYSGTNIFYYASISDVIIYSVDLAVLKKHAKQDPVVYRDLLYVSSARLESNIQRLENMSLKTTHRRIAHLLVYFSNKFGDLEKDGIKIMVPVTHQVLADSLNLARETVTRRLARLEEKGLISVAGKSITVLNLDKLKDEVRI